MGFTTFSFLQSAKASANDSPTPDCTTKIPRPFKTFSPRVFKSRSSRAQAALKSELAECHKATESSSNDDQPSFIIRHNASGCPYLYSTSTMSISSSFDMSLSTPSSDVPSSSPPSDASRETSPPKSPPRSPRFQECFSDELAPTEEELFGSKAISLRPRSVKGDAATSSTSASTSADTTSSPGRRSSRSEARRKERARDSITMIPNDQQNADVELLGSAIESALRLDSTPLVSKRRLRSQDKLLPDPPQTSTTPSRSSAAEDQQPEKATQAERAPLPQAVMEVPVRPPIYDPLVLAGFQWISPMVTTSRPPCIWTWSKRWSCCQCGEAKTIVEQQLCSNLECQHIRCASGCRVNKH